MPEITAFSGSIKLKHADRGVFITTSTFTQGAINAAKDLNITLVNGEMLTNLMIQYQVECAGHQSRTGKVPGSY